MGIVEIDEPGVEYSFDSRYCVWSQAPDTDEPALEFFGAFDAVQAAQIDSFGLAALAVHVAACRIAADDVVEVLVVAQETNQILGAWTVPGDAFPGRPGWLELPFPTPVAARRLTPVVIIKGVLADGGRLCLSRAIAGGFEDSAFALQLFRAPLSEALVDAVWRWERIGTADRTFLGVEGGAINMPAKAWLGAKVVGGAKLTWSAEGHLRLRMRNGAAAMVVFGDVALANVSTIIAKLALESGFGCDIALSLAILPARQRISSDLAEVNKMAVWWAPVQILQDCEESPTFVLPLDAPAYADVALALRNLGAQSDDYASLDCAGLWLLPKAGKNRQIDHDLFAVDGPELSSEAAFEDVRLNESLANESYRHVDMTIVALSDVGHYWERVKFKLFETRDSFGLEFRSGAGFPKIFNIWPGTNRDEFGDFYKISGPEELAAAIETWPDMSDRVLLVALRVILPHLIQQLKGRGELDGAIAARWQDIALRLRG